LKDYTRRRLPSKGKESSKKKGRKDWAEPGKLHLCFWGSQQFPYPKDEDEAHEHQGVNAFGVAVFGVPGGENQRLGSEEKDEQKPRYPRKPGRANSLHFPLLFGLPRHGCYFMASAIRKTNGPKGGAGPKGPAESRSAKEGNKSHRYPQNP
jgi:hypothetical protein